MVFTVPIITSLNLSWDWPACRPDAVSNEMVMVGPRLENVSQANHAAISAVNTGTIQTSGMRRRRRTPAVDRVTGAACSVIVSDPLANALEPRADAEQRAVLKQVGLEQ